MRILHTADWHLGKTLMGRDRTPEIAEALEAMVQLVQSERIDLVVVAGDLFDRVQVAPEAEGVAVRFFRRLAELKVPSVVVAGNHDSHDRLDKVFSPSWDFMGSRVRGGFLAGGEGGVIEVAGLQAGLFPFISERRLNMAIKPFEATQADTKNNYAEKMGLLMGNLASYFGQGPNLLVAHWTLEGAKLGGGEFELLTTNSFAVGKHLLPRNANYVALGHIHRQQQLSEAPVAWYSGSPIQLDFGENEDAPRGALIVELERGLPARVFPVTDKWGRRLRTFRFTTDQFDNRFHEVERWDGYSKVVLEGKPDPVLRDRTYRQVPDCLRVEFVNPHNLGDIDRPVVLPASWLEAYREYLGEKASPGLLSKFEELLAEVRTGNISNEAAQS